MLADDCPIEVFGSAAERLQLPNVATGAGLDRLSRDHPKVRLLRRRARPFGLECLARHAAVLKRLP